MSQWSRRCDNNTKGDDNNPEIGDIVTESLIDGPSSDSIGRKRLIAEQF